MLAVLEERSAQHAFLHGAEFAQCAVAASVRYRRARFEPAHTEYFNRKVHHHAPSVHEHARAPELRAEHEAPFRRLERGLELAHLKQSNCRGHAVRHYRETRSAAGRPFGADPRNELLETFDRGWRRRDEA